MAQQGRSGAAFAKENLAKKRPQQNVTWERGPGLKESAAGGTAAELCFAAAPLLPSVPSASHGTEVGTAKKIVGIWKIQQHLLWSRSREIRISDQGGAP